MGEEGKKGIPRWDEFERQTVARPSELMRFLAYISPPFFVWKNCTCPTHHFPKREKKGISRRTGLELETWVSLLKWSCIAQANVTMFFFKKIHLSKYFLETFQGKTIYFWFHIKTIFHVWIDSLTSMCARSPDEWPRRSSSPCCRSKSQLGTCTPIIEEKSASSKFPHFCGK